jgi:3-hydroxyisobutyrate dehydrogenase-like beta-hydroxyacid dehydrogenase
MRLAVLHIGDMGATVAACLQAAGHEVCWLPQGRGPVTRARADDLKLQPLDDMAAIAACEAVVSVCPPHAALDVARTVFGAGFKGLYLDLNAISPATMQAIAALAGQARLVDGGIIGGATRQPGRTHLHVCGPHADEALALFEGGFLETHRVEGGIGAASALKMTYAAWTKGTSALLAAIRATAAANGVEAALLAQWSVSNPDVLARSEAVGATAARAWRWSGEMHEIAATFAAAGLPGGFHEAAAEVFDRLATFRTAEDGVSAQDLTAALLECAPRAAAQ